MSMMFIKQMNTRYSLWRLLWRLISGMVTASSAGPVCPAYDPIIRGAERRSRQNCTSPRCMRGEDHLLFQMGMVKEKFIALWI